MTQIFGWQADQSGCGYYRIKLPMDALRQHYGLDVRYGMRLNRQDPPQLLVGQRLGQPRTLELLKWLRREYGTRLIYEVDDDLFNVPPKNPAAKVYNSTIRQGMIDCIRLADHVTASTVELADQLTRITSGLRSVSVLENSVPDVAFSNIATQRAGAEGPVVIGWRGSATHVEDFAEVQHGLARILDRPDVRLKLIGASPTNKLPKAKVQHTGWIKDIEDFYDQLDFDIGIVPLADNVFNQSKSHLAVLEMAARGIPVIASNLPSYRRFIEHGVNGFLVSQKHEWAKYLKILIEDPELRHSMGDAATIRAMDFRTIKLAPGYLNLYNSVMGVSV